MANLSTGQRNLPWYDTTHDKILTRRLDLNQQRHLEEVQGHKAAKKTAPKKSPKAKASTKPASAPTYTDLPLFSEAED